MTTEVLDIKAYEDSDYWEMITTLVGQTQPTSPERKALSQLILAASSNVHGLTDERKKRVLEYAQEFGIPLAPKLKAPTASPANKRGKKKKDALEEKLADPQVSFNDKVRAAAALKGPEVAAAVAQSEALGSVTGAVELPTPEPSVVTPAYTQQPELPMNTQEQRGVEDVEVVEANEQEEPPYILFATPVKIVGGQGCRIQVADLSEKIILDRALTRVEVADLFCSFVSATSPHDDATIRQVVAAKPELPAPARLTGQTVYYAEWSSATDGFVTKRAYEAFVAQRIVNAPKPFGGGGEIVPPTSAGVEGGAVTQPPAQIQAAQRGDGLTWSDAAGEIKRVSMAVITVAPGQPFEVLRNAEVKSRKYVGPSVNLETAASARGLLKVWIDLAQNPAFDSHRFAQFLSPLSSQLG